MNGSAVEIPYKHFSEWSQSADFLFTVPAQPNEAAAPRRHNYFLVSLGSPPVERRALFALESIGFEQSELSAWHQLKGLREVPSDWNSYGAAAPNAYAQQLAMTMLEALTAGGIVPKYVQPSPEGGVTMSFVRAAKHAALELHNDGGAVAVISRVAAMPEVWEFTPGSDDQATTIERLAAYIQA